MKRRTIAIDVDDVLAAHVPAFIAFSNERYGTSLTIDDYVDHWAVLWRIEHAEAEERAAEFHSSVGAQEYETVQASNEAIERLKQDYDLTIITARRREMIEPTYGWLQSYYPDVFNEVHFVPIWEPNNTVTKADICRQIGAEYLIDDLPSHCNVAAQGGIKPLLFGDYPWNRNEQIEDGVVRVPDWPAVVEYFYGTQ
jgi:5'(3')-deoxyribonucleotidase